LPAITNASCIISSIEDRSVQSEFQGLILPQWGADAASAYMRSIKSA
jgi:hypothetical protein